MPCKKSTMFSNIVLWMDISMDETRSSIVLLLADTEGNLVKLINKNQNITNKNN